MQFNQVNMNRGKVVTVGGVTPYTEPFGHYTGSRVTHPALNGASVVKCGWMNPREGGSPLLLVECAGTIAYVKASDCYEYREPKEQNDSQRS